MGRNSIKRGIQIDFKEQFSKQVSSIRINFDSFSNVTSSRCSHLKKHFRGSISTLRGIQIDCNELSEKHNSSIRVNIESDSNVIVAICEWSKQHWGRVSTRRGMTADGTEQFWKQKGPTCVKQHSVSNFHLPILLFQKAKPSIVASEWGRWIDLKEHWQN
jgi:hypothetical protein